MNCCNSGLSSGEPADLERMSRLTHMSPAPTARITPSRFARIALRCRNVLFALLTGVDAVAYATGTISILFFCVSALRGRREPGTEAAFAGLVLCGSLVGFSLAMGAVDVLGFPILRLADAYNCLGYSPLSVAAAFGFVLLPVWSSPPPDSPAKGADQSLHPVGNRSPGNGPQSAFR